MNARKELLCRGEKSWDSHGKNDFNFDAAIPLFINAMPYARNDVIQKEIMHETRRDLHQVIWRSKSEEFKVLKNSQLYNSSQFSDRRSPLELRQEFSVEKVEKAIMVNTKRTLALRVMRNKKRQTRKISLDWSTYSTSDSTVNKGFDKRLQYLQRKYFTKWKFFVKEKIISRETTETSSTHSEDHHFDTKYKSPISRKIRERERIDKLQWQNQSKKLVEQANKIKELELTRLKLEEQLYARDVQEMLKENQNKSPSTGSRTSIVSFQEGSEDFSKKDPNRLKAGWEWVMRMEIRARERQQRRDDIRERRHSLEMEKAEKARLEEEKRKQQEDQQKKQRALEIKQEIRRRTELKKKQEEERIRLNNLNVMANEFHKLQLLRSSFASLVLFLDHCRSLMADAENFYNRKLLLNSLVALNLFRKIEIRIKKEKADESFENLLLKKSFNAIKKVYLDEQIEMKKAEDSNKFRLVRSCFSSWFSYHIHQKCESLKKYELAVQHHERSLMRQYFRTWKQLPMIHFHEREKEQRFRTWYTKVQELLPDFHPSNIIEC